MHACIRIIARYHKASGRIHIRVHENTHQSAREERKAHAVCVCDPLACLQSVLVRGEELVLTECVHRQNIYSVFHGETNES